MSYNFVDRTNLTTNILWFVKNVYYGKVYLFQVTDLMECVRFSNIYSNRVNDSSAMLSTC